MNYTEELDLIRLCLDRAALDLDKPETALRHLDLAHHRLEGLRIDLYHQTRISGVPYEVKT